MEFTVDCILTFVKYTDLTDWLHHSLYTEHMSAEACKVAAERYGKERPVYLTAQMCYSISRKTFCRIKCPINPLPVVGWFETPNVAVLKRSLEAHGWKLMLVQPKELIT